MNYDNQLESGKYFELIVRRIKQIEEGVIQPRPQGFSLGWVLSTEAEKKSTTERVEMISCKIVSAARTILEIPASTPKSYFPHQTLNRFSPL